MNYASKYGIYSSGVPRNFVPGGVQQILLRTEDRENGDLGDGSPLVRFSEGSCNLVKEVYSKFTDIRQHDKYLLDHIG